MCPLCAPVLGGASPRWSSLTFLELGSIFNPVAPRPGWPLHIRPWVRAGRECLCAKGWRNGGGDRVTDEIWAKMEGARCEGAEKESEDNRARRCTEFNTLCSFFIEYLCRLIVSAETGRKPLRWRVLLFFYLIKNNRMHRPHITCTPLTMKQRQSWKMCERSCLKDGCRLWYT